MFCFIHKTFLLFQIFCSKPFEYIVWWCFCLISHILLFWRFEFVFVLHIVVMDVSNVMQRNLLVFVGLKDWHNSVGKHQDHTSISALIMQYFEGNCSNSSSGIWTVCLTVVCLSVCISHSLFRCLSETHTHTHMNTELHVYSYNL